MHVGKVLNIALLVLVTMIANLVGQAQVKQIRFVNALPSVCITNIAPPVVYQGKLYQCTSGTYQLSGGGGIGTGDSPTLTGAWVWSLSNAAAVAIGPNGNTNPTARFKTNTASAVTGIEIEGLAAGGGAVIRALSSGTNENLNFYAKGTGTSRFIANNSTSGQSLIEFRGSAGSLQGQFQQTGEGSARMLMTGAGAFASFGVMTSTTHSAFNWYVNGDGDTIIVNNAAVIKWGDAGFARPAIGVVRVTNGSTGAGRLLLGTSSDTSAAQLDVRSQTVGVPAAQFQCASGESATANCTRVKNGAGTTILGFRQDGTFAFDRTLTAGGTTGAQTINKAAFSVNFAAAATSLVVTNSVVATTSGCLCTVQTNDTTMTHVQAVPASGSVTLYANAAPTAETKVYCEIRN